MIPRLLAGEVWFGPVTWECLPGPVGNV